MRASNALVRGQTGNALLFPGGQEFLFSNDDAYVGKGGWSQDDLRPPTFGLRWSHHLDLLDVRLDRGLHFGPHAQKAASRAAPRTMELRRLLQGTRSIPRLVGLLLFRCMVRPILSYAAPVLCLASDRAW